MQFNNNTSSFFQSFLKNRFIIGVIASVIVITVGIFKAIKSSPESSEKDKQQSQSHDKDINNKNSNNNNNNNNNNNYNNTNSKSNKEENEQFLQDLKNEINKSKPVVETTTTTAATTTTTTTTTDNKKLFKKDTDFIALPHQILYQLFELITPQDFTNCSMINKKWNTIITRKLDKCWIQFSIDRWNLQETYPFDETRNNNKEFFKKKYIEEKKRLGFKPEQYIITIMNECSEFTENGRWNSERIINPNGSWWKKRFLEEMSKCLTMTNLVLNDNVKSNNSGNRSNNNKKVYNNKKSNKDESDEDEEEDEDESDEEEEEVGLDNRSPTGNIVLNNGNKSNQPIGSFRFIDKSDCNLKFKGEKWLSKYYTKEDSPYTGDVVGYFNFSLFPLDCDDELFEPYKEQIVEFLRVLTFGSRGTVTRLKNGVSIHSIVFEQCKLNSVFGKYGLNDGDALLDSDSTSSYIISLIEHLQNFLDKKGVGNNAADGGAKVTYINHTSHNPIRYSGHLSKDSLSNFEVGIWIYNSVILSSKRLWNRKLDD